MRHFTCRERNKRYQILIGSGTCRESEIESLGPVEIGELARVLSFFWRKTAGRVDPSKNLTKIVKMEPGHIVRLDDDKMVVCVDDLERRLRTRARSGR